MPLYLFIEEWKKLNANTELVENCDIFKQTFWTSFCDYLGIIVPDLFMYFIWMVYVNLQLEMEGHHENHFQVNGASSLNICIMITIISIRKEKKYQQLLELRSQYIEVHIVNLSMGALGVMSTSSTSFLDMIKDLGFDDNTRSFIVRRLMTISIRATYYIFCRRNRDWPNPVHLTFFKTFFL